MPAHKSAEEEPAFFAHIGGLPGVVTSPHVASPEGPCGATVQGVVARSGLAAAASRLGTTARVEP